MVQTLKKTAYITLGLGLLAKDKIIEKALLMKEKSEKKAQEFKEFKNQMKDNSKIVKDNLEETIHKVVKDTISSIGIATKNDLQDLEEKFKKSL